MSENWAKALTEETVWKIVDLGDGHSLTAPEDYAKAGLPEDVLTRHTVVHKSGRVLRHSAVECATRKLPGLLDTWKDMLFDESDREYCCEQIAKELLQGMVDEGHYDIWAYHPKEAIFVDGGIVDELEAVNSLHLVSELVKSLGVENIDRKIGRGFQYETYRQAIKKHFERNSE